MKLNAFLPLALLSIVSLLGAQEATLVDENPATQWITTQLKSKDSAEWVKKYILALDDKIQDEQAKIFYRRFLSDSNTRSDSIIKFVEYLNLAESDAQKDLTSSIYKAVYFAITYTIMDGLPTGPLKQKETEVRGREAIPLSSTVEDRGEMKRLVGHTRMSGEAKDNWIDDGSYSGRIAQSKNGPQSTIVTGTGSDVVSSTRSAATFNSSGSYQRGAAFQPTSRQEGFTGPARTR